MKTSFPDVCLCYNCYALMSLLDGADSTIVLSSTQSMLHKQYKLLERETTNQRQQVK